MGGRFTLSDDSHGIEQVGLNYDKTLQCIRKAGIEHLCYLAPVSNSVEPLDDRFPEVGWQTILVSDLESHGFWKL